MTKKVIIICYYKYRSARRRGRKYEREEYDEHVPLETKKSNPRFKSLIDENGHICIRKLEDYVREKVRKPQFKKCSVFYHYYD